MVEWITDGLNALVLLTNFVVIPAVTYGSQLALGALGVTLVFGILRFANFAHGDTMAFGAAVTILATWALQGAGAGIAPLPTALLAIPFGILVTATLLLMTDKLVYRHYRRVRAKPVVLVMASVGVMFVLQGLVRLIIGVHDQNFSDGARFIVTAREFKRLTGLNEGLAVKVSQGVTVVAVTVLVLALFWFLQRTRTGKAMRAYSDNKDLALLSGVNPDAVVRITWVLTAVLATVAGVLYGLDKSFKAFIYFQLLLPVFAAAILGGIGNPLGAVAGAYVVAFSEVMLTYPYRKFIGYLTPDHWQPDGLLQWLSTDYKFAVSFLILVAVLVVRPTGLFRGRVIS